MDPGLKICLQKLLFPQTFPKIKTLYVYVALSLVANSNKSVGVFMLV